MEGRCLSFALGVKHEWVAPRGGRRERRHRPPRRDRRAGATVLPRANTLVGGLSRPSIKARFHRDRRPSGTRIAPQSAAFREYSEPTLLSCSTLPAGTAAGGCCEFWRDGSDDGHSEEGKSPARDPGTLHCARRMIGAVSTVGLSAGHQLEPAILSSREDGGGGRAAAWLPAATMVGEERRRGGSYWRVLAPERPKPVTWCGRPGGNWRGRSRRVWPEQPRYPREL